MNFTNSFAKKLFSTNYKQISTILILLSIVSFTSIAYAEVLSPVKQIDMGIAPESVECFSDKTLVIRTNGNPVCLYSGTVEKIIDRFGWKIVEKVSEPIQITDNTSLEQLPPIEAYVENIIFTNSEIEDKIFGGLGPGKDWPKYNVTFPGTAQVGVPFDVVYDYTYVIPDEDTKRYTHPEEQCTDWTCEDDSFTISASTFVDVIKEGKVFRSNTTTADNHLPLRNFTNYDYFPEYDNTKVLSEKFTFVINKPNIDYRIGAIVLDFANDFDYSYFYVDETGKIFFDENLNKERFSTEKLASKFSVTTKDVDSFVLKVSNEIDKLEKIPVVRNVIQGKSDPNGPPRETGLDSRTFYLTNYPGEDYEKFLGSFNYTETFIKSFIGQFPELQPQGFDFVSKFILPSAYGAVTTTYVSGQLSNTDYDNGTSFVHGATVCAYDDTATGIEPISLNGVNVCSETTQSGTFVFNIPIADPNGSGNTDLVLVAEPQNQYIKISENNNGDIPFLEDDDTNTVPSNILTLNVGTFDVSSIDNVTPVEHRHFWAVEELTEIRDWYGDELSVHPDPGRGAFW